MYPRRDRINRVSTTRDLSASRTLPFGISYPAPKSGALRITGKLRLRYARLGQFTFWQNWDAPNESNPQIIKYINTIIEGEGFKPTTGNLSKLMST